MGPLSSSSSSRDGLAFLLYIYSVSYSTKKKPLIVCHPLLLLISPPSIPLALTLTRSILTMVPSSMLLPLPFLQILIFNLFSSLLFSSLLFSSPLLSSPLLSFSSLLFSLFFFCSFFYYLGWVYSSLSIVSAVPVVLTAIFGSKHPQLIDLLSFIPPFGMKKRGRRERGEGRG